MIKKLSIGTQIYLTKKNSKSLCIQPGKTLINDSLYVKYDVRADGQTIVPKGTRVVGDWVTESCPVVAAQLQLTQIFLQADGQKIMADSDLFESLVGYNANEINCSDYFYKSQYQAVSNVIRKIANFGTTTKTLSGDRPNTIYLKFPHKKLLSL